MRFIAIFIAQAWVNDHAIEVDKLGDDTWDVTKEVLDGPAELQEAIRHDRHADLDHLRELPQAPAWCRNWEGPFEVRVQAEPAPTAAGPASIPDTDGRYGRGYRDGLESLRLAIAAAGVAPDIVEGAVQAALDAYGNNADLGEPRREEIQEALVVSTAHLRPSERTVLEDDEIGALGTTLILSMSGSHGWLVYADFPEQPTELEEYLQEIDQRLSLGFAAVMRRAAELGVKHVLFDADADRLDGVASYTDTGELE